MVGKPQMHHPCEKKHTHAQTHTDNGAHIRTREGKKQHGEHNNTVIGKCDCSADTCWQGALGN